MNPHWREVRACDEPLAKRRIILASFFSLMATVSSGSKASAGWFIC
jgi:hypothetical protein